MLRTNAPDQFWTRAAIGRGLLDRKSGLGPQLFITDSSNAVILLCFIPIVIDRPLPVSLSAVFSSFTRGTLHSDSMR